jgi:hypothetical protein
MKMKTKTKNRISLVKLLKQQQQKKNYKYCSKLNKNEQKSSQRIPIKKRMQKISNLAPKMRTASAKCCFYTINYL